MKRFYIAIFAFICISMQVNALDFDTLRVYPLNELTTPALKLYFEKLGKSKYFQVDLSKVQFDALRKSMVVIPNINIYATDTVEVKLEYTQGDMPPRKTHGIQSRSVYVYFDYDNMGENRLYNYWVSSKSLSGRGVRPRDVNELLKELVKKSTKGLIFNVRLFAYPNYDNLTQYGNLTLLAYQDKESKQMIFADVATKQEYNELDEFLIAKFGSVEKYAKLTYQNEHYYNNNIPTINGGIWRKEENKVTY